MEQFFFKHLVHPTFFDSLVYFYEKYNGKVSEYFKFTSIVTKEKKIKFWPHRQPKYSSQQNFPAEMLIIIFLKCDQTVTSLLHQILVLL